MAGMRTCVSLWLSCLRWVLPLGYGGVHGVCRNPPPAPVSAAPSAALCTQQLGKGRVVPEASSEPSSGSYCPHFTDEN